jgi:hypothetical protein
VGLLACLPGKRFNFHGVYPIAGEDGTLPRRYRP